MHTLASAATLLNHTTSIESTPPLLVELGFAADLVPLDRETLHRLRIFSEDLGSPRIAQGNGSLRALVFITQGGTPLRSTVARAAARLSQTTPHLLWLIVAIADTNELAIATWDPGADRPKIAALVARRGAIVDSDAETLCTLSASITTSDIATHRRWLEILGRQSITRRFFRCLQRSVGELAAGLSPAPPSRDAADLALIYTSRLLFLSFLETKGWLDRDHAFLANRYADCMLKGGRYHQTVLAPLFFGTLNTHPRNRAPRAMTFGKIPFLNGGLFARSRLERDLRHSRFTDETVGDLFDNLLTRYRFTAREDSTAWSEAAIDPEMLGKSFEALMASSDRKTTGAFYTPQPLVDQLTSSGLVRALSSQDAGSDTIARALAGEIPSPLARTTIIEKIGKIRVLDPSCGSGAFLVHTLETLSSLCTRLGDVRPLHTIRRSILTSSIFGVDINPTAVWLCELRLWLSMAIEDPERDPLRVRPLPNLDRQVRVGDSLAGSGFRDDDKVHDPGHLTKARERYARATGPRKRNLSRTLDRGERARAAESIATKIRSLSLTRRDLVSSIRSRDLFGERRLHPTNLLASLGATRVAIRDARRSAKTLARGAALPFSFQTHFADVGARGGFDLVIGNPPWVRTHKLEPAARARFRREFWVFRHSAWTTGARSAAATNGFASQVDLAALFGERSIQLTRPSGAIALLVPAKLWRSLAGGGLRRYLLSHTRLAELHDLSESRQMFDAAVYPSLVMACRDSPADERAKAVTSTEPPNNLRVVVHRGESVVQWNVHSRCLAFDPSPGSPWLLLPPEVRLACDRLTNAGRPLSQSVIGRPMLGVKTGCNDAFVVSAGPSPDEDGLACVHSSDRSSKVERALLRPLIRGDIVVAWRFADSDSCILWTHGEDGAPLRRLPYHTGKWLGHWRRRLECRSDARGKEPWWMLFRTESASPSAPRVIWSDIGKTPRAVAIAAGNNAVPLNSCYAAQCRDMTDAHAFAALLNSPVTAAWLNTIAEPARGGYNRYLGWTVALLPTPLDWLRTRSIMAPIGKAAACVRPPASHELIAATLDAFRLAHADIEPLMTWSSR